MVSLSPFDKLRVTIVSLSPFDKLRVTIVSLSPFDKLRVTMVSLSPFDNLRNNAQYFAFYRKLLHKCKVERGQLPEQVPY